MKKFEVGKRYFEEAANVYEVVSRTAKTLTIVEIRHAGRFNEKRLEEKKIRVREWDGVEVIFPHNQTVTA